MNYNMYKCENKITKLCLYNNKLCARGFLINLRVERGTANRRYSVEEVKAMIEENKKM